MQCAECGATYANGDDSCAARFEALLALDHSRREPWGSRHGQAFAAYALQHPRAHAASLDRAWEALYRIHVEGEAPARVFGELVAGRRVAAPVPARPARRHDVPAVTIADLGDFDAATWPERLDAWCRAAMASWGANIADGRAHPLRTVTLLLALAALGAPAAAAAQRSDTAVVRRVAGCYRLETGSFTPERHARLPGPTTLARLDSVPAPAWMGTGSYRAERLVPDSAATSSRSPGVGPQPRAVWRVVSPESLAVVLWSNGFEAEVFYGRVTGDGLRGVVRSTSDARIVDPATGTFRWDAYPTAPSTGTRVPCPGVAR